MLKADRALWIMGKGCVGIVAIMALTLPGTVQAGQKPHQPVVAEEVVVTQSGSGEELRGRLVNLSPGSLAILVDGNRVEIPMDNVLRIDARHDSLKNGAIIGAAVMGGLSAISCGEVDDAAFCVTGLVVNTGLGALIGAGIDALHKGRTPIYIKTGRSSSALQVRIRF